MQPLQTYPVTLPSAFGHLLAATSSAVPQTALGLAYAEAVKGVGRTRPNPPVGCVVVDDDGLVLASGFHQLAGEPHAEVMALGNLGAGEARGKTVVVTLEPCTHHGRTPPCVGRLLHEGVRRVVVGSLDPNPLVHGQGVAQLRQAGVEVEMATGVDARRCQSLLAPFASSQTRHRPFVVLKISTSLDGKVATRTGSSRSITGPSARVLVHRLRDAVDAVVVGAATVLTDDPALTVRDVAGRDPLRVVLDRRGRVPASARVFADANVTVLSVSTIGEVLAVLHQRGLLAVVVEAGPQLATAFLQAGVVDELWWFHAPIYVGSDGLSAVSAGELDDINQAPRFEVVTRGEYGEDMLTVLRQRPTLSSADPFVM